MPYINTEVPQMLYVSVQTLTHGLHWFVSYVTFVSLIDYTTDIPLELCVGRELWEPFSDSFESI